MNFFWRQFMNDHSFIGSHFPSDIIFLLSIYFCDTHSIKPVTGCSGAKITSMLVPKWVQNGTEEQIILDCDYDVDLSRDKNLTIKWYFRDKTELIYEWIPRLDFRYVSGRLQGRFNWDFVLNTSHMPSLKKYRAIAIRKPTTEMSGRYICQVLSTAGDDSEEATMVIYGKNYISSHLSSADSSHGSYFWSPALSWGSRLNFVAFSSWYPSSPPILILMWALLMQHFRNPWGN